MVERTAAVAAVLAALAALVLVAGASATPSGLVVIGSGQRSAHGSQTDAYALYLRGYGRHLSASFTLDCFSQTRWGGHRYGHSTRSHMQPGRLYPLHPGDPYAPRTLSYGDCTVAATLHGSGRLRLQILALTQPSG